MMKTLKIFQLTEPRFNGCSKCRAGELHKSRAKNSFEQILKKYTFFNMYRCQSCGWRGIKSHYILNSDSFKAIGIYLLIAILAAFIVRFVITKFLIS